MSPTIVAASERAIAERQLDAALVRLLAVLHDIGPSDDDATRREAAGELLDAITHAARARDALFRRLPGVIYQPERRP